MDFFRKYFNDCAELLIQVGSDSGEITDLDLMLFRGYLGSLDDRYIVSQFVKKCFPHLETLRLRETPEPLLDLLKTKNFMGIYESLDDEMREDFWELIHGMVRSSIVWIDHIRKNERKVFVEKYFKYKPEKLAETWGVALTN